MAETHEPGVTVSLVARRHGIAPNQVFSWRRLAAQGALTAAGAEEEVVPASDYRALQNQFGEAQRLLGKKTMEAEILKAVDFRRELALTHMWNGPIGKGFFTSFAPAQDGALICPA